MFYSEYGTIRNKGDVIYVFVFIFSYIANDAMEDEDGEFRAKEDREHRSISETEKVRVTWNTERRCYMEGSAAKRYIIVCVHINFIENCSFCK